MPIILVPLITFLFITMITLDFGRVRIIPKIEESRDLKVCKFRFCLAACLFGS